MAWVDRNTYRLHRVGEAGRLHDGQFRQLQFAHLLIREGPTFARNDILTGIGVYVFLYT